MMPVEPDSIQSPNPTPESDRGGARKEVVIALLILAGLIGTIVVVFLFVTPNATTTSAAQQHKPTGSWFQSVDSDPAVDKLTSAQLVSPTDTGTATEKRAGYAPQPAAVVESVSANGDIVKSGTVENGVPVIKSLTRLGLTMADAHALISALDGIFDFRRSRPGQMFELRQDKETEEPVYFRYEASLVEVYEVTRQNQKWVGRKKRIQTQKVLRRFGGTIASSLYKALSELDAHPSLAGRMVDVLSNQVDFYKEQRPGDTFRVIVEEERLKGTFLGYGPVLALEYRGTKAGRKRFYYFAPHERDKKYYDDRLVSQPSSAISIPLHYTRISSPFGFRYHPILKRKRLHNGVDFAAGHGTPVWACQAGTVTTAGRRGANGNLVIIRHDNDLQSYYAHLQRFARGIKSGIKVRERQVVGYVGSTGRSTGAHLHFGLKLGGRFVDPLKYKLRPGRPVPGRHRAALKTLVAQHRKQLDQTTIRAATAPLAKPPEDHGVLGLEEEL